MMAAAAGKPQPLCAFVAQATLLLFGFVQTNDAPAPQTVVS